MANMTLKIPDELREKLQEHKTVNWSAVARRAMQEHLNKIEIAERIASKSKFTKKDADEISKLIKRDMARELGLR